MNKSTTLTNQNFFGWKWAIVLVLILCFIAFLFWAHNRNTRIADNKKDFLFKNGKFAIGEVTGVTYSGGNNFSIVSAVMYFFYIDKQKNEGSLNGNDASSTSKESKREFVSFNGNREGERFFVLYEEQNKSNSLLCLDRPVRDSTDFKKYVKEFEKMR